MLKPSGPPSCSLTRLPCHMKQQGALLPSPGWDTSPSQGPLGFPNNQPVPIDTLGWGGAL